MSEPLTFGFGGGAAPQTRAYTRETASTSGSPTSGHPKTVIAQTAQLITIPFIAMLTVAGLAG